MKKIVLAAVLMSIPQMAAAQSMNAEQFYRRATALQKKGMLALFSGGEIKVLMAEGKASGAKARQQRLAAVSAGRRARYCPPGDVHGMDSNEFIKRLGDLPAADRTRIGMLEAMNRILAVKYPCRA
jgi:hypothetical protein